ncbi:MAG: pyrroline-5-carboxylate reductase [Lachnospiraceae bacterium]|nr:pyrroline-5-carboxylate reductase [Lachnospiraceae bacterium]
MNTVGFIGCGNMGSAIATAVAKAIEPSQILLANKTASKAEALAASLGCQAGSNAKAAENCTYIFLGVKPQMMADMLTPLQPVLRERTDAFVLVTMAAGLTIADIQAMADGSYPVIRIMPNTPVAIGQGMIQACASPEVTECTLAEFQMFMKECGRLDFLPEHLIDAASALSGCGPAYVYLFLEALADGAVECGLPRQKAYEYASQTLIGAASMVLETGRHPGELKDAVCSPGGTTIAGVHALERDGLRNAAMDAVKAAYDRTAALKK